MTDGLLLNQEIKASFITNQLQTGYKLVVKIISYRYAIKPKPKHKNPHHLSNKGFC